MRIRVLDENWDWKYGRSENDYASEALAVAYDLKTKIWSWYGDCFFDQEAGIDWLNRLGSKDQKEFLDGDLKKIASTQQYVTEIVSFESTLEERIYHAQMVVKTVFNKTIEIRI